MRIESKSSPKTINDLIERGYTVYALEANYFLSRAMDRAGQWYEIFNFKFCYFKILNGSHF